MLYLLGGASRAGKSYLARKLLKEHGVPYFSIDTLMMGLANGAPEFGLDPNDSGEVRGEKLWPILRAMVVNLLEEVETHPAYLMEGDELLPGYVAEFLRAYPGQVKACFIGYTDVDAAAKLADIRRTDTTWMDWAGDEAALASVVEAVEFSRYVARECAVYGIPYFDCSRSPASAVAAALNCLLAPATG
ncbi:MAG: hypothetical protein ACYC5O_07190 [Anaerolineae bacterium]